MEFKNRSYWEKRGILRNSYEHDVNIHEAVKSLAFEVKSRLRNPILNRLDDMEYIVEFLVSGYLAFVREKPGHWIQKDPCNLELSTGSNNELRWSEWQWKDIVGDYHKNDVVYISHYNDELSFVNQLYTGLIDTKNEEFIMKHVEYVINALSRNFLDIEKVLKIDDNVKRSFKLNKILSNYE